MPHAVPRRLPHACGLDFGTSNSTLGVFRANGPELLFLEGANTTVPSAVFFGLDKHDALLIGRAAIGAYVDGVGGRFMRALKSILGTALVDETTRIARRRISFQEIVGTYVRTLKARAEMQLGEPLDHVVLGRPVHFVDDDQAADAAAETTLAAIAKAVGFAEVSFQFEPVAAAFAFEREIAGETLALIADIGGGTSDFTVVRLDPARRTCPDRRNDILANDGARIGGTDYDRALSMASVMPALGYGTPMSRGDVDVPSGPYFDLSTWSSVNRLYDPKILSELRHVRRAARRPELVERLIRVIDHRRGHSILIDVETAKIDLTEQATTRLALDWIEPGLSVTASRETFEESTGRQNERLRAAALACVARAGLTPEAIDVVFFTGGTSLVPAVRRAVLAAVPQARPVDGDRFGAVGLGLALEAQRRYG
ncbi:Putative heat shock protein YegD [Rhodovulum sp. PH10]|nr:Putative heat shock protein YegD [Rhodovulum sp. PH10]